MNKMNIISQDELDRKLAEMERHSQAVKGADEASLAERLTDAFVREHTDFASLQEMIADGGIEKNEDFQTDNWNAYIMAHSDFESWNAMLEAAAAE